jgi:membrane protein DedA with SNARE-associated domain
MDGLAQWGLALLDQHAELVIFCWLLLEESGIPMPLPGDLAAVLAGARVGQGRMHLLAAVVVIEAATLAGASVLYWLARRGGRPMLHRYGRYLHLTPERLRRAEQFLQRRGLWAVVVGRLVPGLRVATTVTAGALGVPYRTFLAGAAIGSNNLPFFLLGWFVGPAVLDALHGLRLSLRLVVILVGIVVVGAAFHAIRRRAQLTTAAHRLPEQLRLEVGLLAGLLATAITATMLNVLLYVLVLVDVNLPARALYELGLVVGLRLGLRTLVAVAICTVLYVALQLAWAVVYAHVERWLPRPDWLGGLLFALVPLAVSLLVVLPLLGAGVAGLGLHLGLVPLAGEVLRHAVFGWTLAVSYTLISRARVAPRPQAAPQSLAA